ncbi:trehalose-phosphatase [candidate division KSB1 bacterium]|nr:trehalose-phosphatase [candidate division KSB1 bacterium]
MPQKKTHNNKYQSKPRKAKQIPAAIDEWKRIQKQIQAKTPVLFLDYDGTLTPIVQQPEDAILSDDIRDSLEILCRYIQVIIISGRDRRDVEKLVGIDNLIYAGSHGFDINGPDGLNMQHEGGINALPSLEAAEELLNEKLEETPGVRIERKKYAIAVHYRNSPEREIPLIQKTMDRVAAEYNTLRQTGGKKIIELRPDIDWDKGKALLWLLRELGLKDEAYLPIYIGDDLTDEDAFRVLNKDGMGILVGEHGDKSDADYRLDSINETGKFLRLLVKQLRESMNMDSKK